MFFRKKTDHTIIRYTLIEPVVRNFQRRDALVELLHLIGGVALLGLHLVGERLIEAARRKVLPMF